MKIVIDIPEETYKGIMLGKWDKNGLAYYVKDGTILPKGHGRLIDADELLKAIDTWDKFGFEHTGCFVRNPEDDFITYVHHDDIVISIRDAETIIEADKEGSGDA